MSESILLRHERVDDIPLLIGLAQRLNLPAVLDKHLGSHRLHQGLSNGWLATVWLAFILSEGDHRKCTVQGWVGRHQHTLEQLLGQSIRPVEFSDDRLGIVLHRLSPTSVWERLEADLFESTVAVYELEVTQVRCDSTTVSGYHAVREEGVLQYGHSKDHRPDLAQLKLMAAAAQPSGLILASDVHPGQCADDPLYLPLIARVRALLGRSGLLYVGDCKMAAITTRAGIVAGGDHYLTSLPATTQEAAQREAWIDALVEGRVPLVRIERDGELLGEGYELERPLRVALDDEWVEWTERVVVVRSDAYAARQQEHLAARLAAAEQTLKSLTPAPGRGKRQVREEGALSAAVTQVLKQHRVEGLLQVTWEREERVATSYIGRGRGGPERATREHRKVRYQITSVRRDAAAIDQAASRLGIQVLVTAAPAQTLSLSQAVLGYREGWSLERDFHLMKDRPLGIGPLYVWRDDQVVGLTHLLVLALRLLTLIEMQVRRSLADQGESLKGLYEGQPQRTTDRPTAVALLKAVARSEITLTRIEGEGACHWYLTPLTALVERILFALKLSPSLYARLAENST